MHSMLCTRLVQAPSSLRMRHSLLSSPRSIFTDHVKSLHDLYSPDLESTSAIGETNRMEICKISSSGHSLEFIAQCGKPSSLQMPSSRSCTDLCDILQNTKDTYIVGSCRHSLNAEQTSQNLRILVCQYFHPVSSGIGQTI